MINGFYVFSHSFQSVNESAIGQAVAQGFRQSVGRKEDRRTMTAGM